jgi:predicted MFS family arabinose efflux permease
MSQMKPGIHQPRTATWVPWLTVLSMITTGVAGASMMLIMPGVLSAIAQQRSLDSAQVAFIASAEMGGIMAGTVAVATFIAGATRRGWALAALALVVAAHVASLFASGFGALIASRLAAGCAEGTLLGIMTVSVSGVAQPDRIFALYMASNLSTSTALLAALRRLIELRHPEYIFWILCVIATIALVLLPFLPDRAPLRDPSPPTAGPASRQAVLGLTGTMILFVGIGATWPLVGQMGGALGFSGGELTLSLSLATGMGILAGLLASVLGVRWGRQLPIIVGTLGVAAAMAGLLFGEAYPIFTIAVCVYMFSWVFLVPYYTGVMAAIDASGRMASLSMATQFLGLALGPLAAAGIIHGDGLRSPLTVGAGLSVSAIAFMIAAERRL